MKKVFLSIMAALLVAVAPVNCFASRHQTSSRTDEAVYAESSEDGIKMTPEMQENYDLERYVMTFKPTAVTATAKDNGIVVNANITTAAKRLMVQYSTDKTFKKNVTTTSYVSSGYVGNAMVTIKDIHRYKYDEKTWTTWYYHIGTRAVAQNGVNLAYRKVEGTEYTPLYITDSLVKTVREKIPCKKTFTVSNVKNAKTYYVRVRSQYIVGDYRFYSPWVTVKVK